MNPGVLKKENILDFIVEAGKLLDAQAIPKNPRWIQVPGWMARMMETETPSDFFRRKIERINELKALNWNEKTILKRIKKENRREGRSEKGSFDVLRKGKIGHIENFSIYASNS
jgi:hypothetical protein